MMRILLTSLTTILLAAAPAWAQSSGPLSGFYIGGFGGVTYLSDQEIEEGGVELEIEYDVPGYVFGGQIGYALDTNIRLEAELAYAFSEGDASLQLLGVELLDAQYDLSVLSMTAGIYFDLWPVGTFVPYVGAGLGYARVTNEVDDDEDTQGAFTAFGEGGLPIALSPNLSLVPSARFSWVATDEDVDELFADDLFSTQARLGVRYTF
jgi:opacity protein-like surface antigen